MYLYRYIVVDVNVFSQQPSQSLADMTTYITAGYPAGFFDVGHFASSAAGDEQDERRNNFADDRLQIDHFNSSKISSGKAFETKREGRKHARHHSNEFKVLSIKPIGKPEGESESLSEEISVTTKLEALAKAYTVTPGNLGYFPALIRGKGVEDVHAKEAAMRLMKGTPIVKDAIVFEQGKKPRIVKAMPNIIVL